MKTLYLILTIVICLSIILFVATILYIDTHRHTMFRYDIYKGDNLTSAVQMDKYNTEDKIVYKSTTLTPFHSVSDMHKRNLSIDKKRMELDTYNKKDLSEGVSMNVYIKAVDSSINFLAVGHSNFAYARRLPVDKDFIVFEKEAPISYFNLIDRYDFKKGGVQSLPILTHTYTFLPPYRSRVEARMVGEDVAEVDGRKIKALQFKLRLPDKNEISLWINWWTHIPLIIKIPRTGFKAVMTEKPKEISAKKFSLENEAYKNREVSFKNNEVSLAGTLSVPQKGGPFPAVLLVWGPGPQDRDALGIFTKLADGLAANGIAVLRFDKRGVGKSEGNFSKFTGEDLIEDVSSAVDFLSKTEEIDAERIAVLGYSEGGYYAASVAAGRLDISACIIMAGIEAINLPDTSLEMMWKFDKSAMDWDQEYMQDIAKCAKDTLEVLKSGKDWALLLHRRVFLKKGRLDMQSKPLEVIRKVKVPVLILRGKKDTVIPAGHIKLLEEALKEGGNKDYETVYFNRLNHFFGKKIEDGIHRTYISLDKEVISAIVSWLNKKLISHPMVKPEPKEKSVSEGWGGTEEEARNEKKGAIFEKSKKSGEL